MNLQQTKKEGKLKRYSEKILKLVAEGKFGGNLGELREYSVKNKFVPSRGKFDKALSVLKNAGRVCVNGKTVLPVVDDVNGILLTQIDTKIEKEVEEMSLNKKNRFEANIFDGIEKISPKFITGKVLKTDHDNLIFIANNGNIYTILNKPEERSQFQDKICVMKVDDVEKEMKMGHIVNALGDAGNPISEYDSIAKAHGANMGWEGEELQKEIDQIPTHVDLSGRKLVDQDGNILQDGLGDAIVDLRDLPFVTVDPFNCKDMDDAIYSTYENGDLVVYTAVANVPKYVKLDSEIGRKYIQGAFTIYAPNKAYNILPPKISTGICSLNEGQDRFAVVIKTTVDEKTGIPKSSKIMDAVINSHRKLSYVDAQEICDFSNESMTDLKEKISQGESLTIEEQIVFNEKASDVLWKGFKKRNTISFYAREEYDVVFNEDFSNIEDIKPSENCPYHKVIEAFMLTANEATAKFTIKHKIPNIYRIHDKPDKKKVEQTTEFFNVLGMNFDGDLSVRGIKKLLIELKDTPKEAIANRFLIRMQSKAKYSDDIKRVSNIKKINNDKKFEESAIFEELNFSLKGQEAVTHFALQSEAYSHSTSPIRRLPDYVTLNNIMAYINGHEDQMIDKKIVHEIAGWANDLQEENSFAEAEFREFNSACFCEDKIGMVLRGQVSGFRKRNGFEGIDNLDVVVEEAKRGLKILVPATEFVGNAKNAVVSKSGVAIVNKYTSEPYLALCSEIIVEIISADRRTHIVRGSSRMEKAKTNKETNFDFHVGGRSRTREGKIKIEHMLSEREYKQRQKEEDEEIENRKERRGKKELSSICSKTGVEADANEAFQRKGKNNQKETRKKQYPRNITL